MALRSLILMVLLLPGAQRAWAQPPDMSSLWPNNDGMSWTFEQVTENFLDGTSSNTTVRLRFEGTMFAAGGIEAQNLVEEWVGPLPLAGEEPWITDPLLRNIWRARPDLREAIEAKAHILGSASPALPTWDALLLHGGAFEKNEEEIINWQSFPELSSGKSWLYLVSDLTPGNTFSLQLVPDLASDVFLFGTVAAIEEVSVPAGTFPDCVRVDYTIDYGMSLCTSEGSPDPLGSFRSETVGSVSYAPNVGPVRSVEDFIPFVEGDAECDVGYEIGQVVLRITLALAETSASVDRRTWGQIKARYGD